MSHVTITNTTPPVTVVCSEVLLISITITIAPTAVGQMTLGKHDVVLPPQLIPMDTMEVSTGHTNMPQQHCIQV